jgi:hypothetical protein
MHTGFSCKNLKERGHLEHQGIDGRIVVKWILREIGWEGVELITLSEQKDMSQVLADTIRNLQVPQNMGNFLTSSETI